VDLRDIMAKLGGGKNPNLLIGFDTSDDAAVYRLTDDLALVQTTDFITPVVDDPYLFGQIAAANSISDVYAKGGRPLTALNICCFPEPGSGLESSHLKAIVEGGLDKITEAGAILVGGHTVKDSELKYGLAVTGVVHPRDIKPNTGAKEGDAVLITKPIGTGVIGTAIKKGIADPEAARLAGESMAALNRRACELMVEMKAHAATDITGFGLANHLLNVAKASGVGLELRLSEIPVLPTVMKLLKEGVKTGVTFSNEQAAHKHIQFDALLSREEQLLFFDPQTSGGLAIFIPERAGDELLKRLSDEGIPAKRIGEVVVGPGTMRVFAS
jgi:selenide, water dikinase